MFWIILGVLLIAVAGHDLFHTLFHPAKSGALSDWLAHGVWRVISRAKNRRLLTLAGPFAMLTIVTMWALLIVLGAAFLYWPNLSKDIVVAPGLNQAEHLRFSDAVNLSLGSVITFGGDLNSRSQMLRLVMGLESVLGFGVLTGSISWLLSVYPVLERRASLAHELTLLHGAEQQTGIHLFDLPEEVVNRTVLGFATAVTTLRNDMIQFPVTYYFHAGTRQAQFPTVLPFLWSIAEQAQRRTQPASVRLAGNMLHCSLMDLLDHLGKIYLDPEIHDPLAIIETYLREHRNEPLIPLRPQRPPVAA